MLSSLHTWYSYFLEQINLTCSLFLCQIMRVSTAECIVSRMKLYLFNNAWHQNYWRGHFVLAVQPYSIRDYYRTLWYCRFRTLIYVRSNDSSQSMTLVYVRSNDSSQRKTVWLLFTSGVLILHTGKLSICDNLSSQAINTSSPKLKRRMLLTYCNSILSCVIIRRKTTTITYAPSQVPSDHAKENRLRQGPFSRGCLQRHILLPNGCRC